MSPLKTKGQKVVGKVNQGKRKCSSIVDIVKSKVAKTLNVPIESFGDTNIIVSQEKAKMFDEMIGLLVSKLQVVNSTKLKIQIMTYPNRLDY